MIELICKYYTIDPNQIYATGHSNGSFMTYRLGYELSNKIAAIATHSGLMVYMPSEATGNKISILHLHALDDDIVPYYGGLSGYMLYSLVDDVLILTRRTVEFGAESQREDTITILRIR